MRLRIMAASGIFFLGMVRPGAEPLWTDELQAGNSPWGFSGLETEHPIDETVSPSDANGANLSRTANPLGAGFALRQYGIFDDGGARSQAGIWSFSNAVFRNQAKTSAGVWVAQEWYFPAAIGGGAWLNLWDWHSTDADGGNRWHTSPGLMLHQNGSMRVRFEWGGPANSVNPMSAYTAAGLPVGRWFDVEMHYQWSASKTATVTLWVDGQMALEQTGVQTRVASHSVIETYIKFYGQGDGSPWQPAPCLKYVRNVRIGNARLGPASSIRLTGRKAPGTRSPWTGATLPESAMFSGIARQGGTTLEIFALDGRRIAVLAGRER